MEKTITMFRLVAKGYHMAMNYRHLLHAYNFIVQNGYKGVSYETVTREIARTGKCQLGEYTIIKEELITSNK